MADDVSALFPLVAETPESIKARMLATINAGIDPTDPLYADAVPGSEWDDMTGAWALEADRLYDRMLTELPASALPATAIGEWLDEWADALDLARKDATTASGVVTFTGADGTDVATGTQVSTEAATPDADPVTFQTTESGVIAAGSVSLAVEAVESGSASDVPANAVTILDSAIDGVSITNAAAITGGSDVETDEALSARVVAKLRGTIGAGNVDYYVNIALNYPGVGFVTVQPNVPTLGHVTLQISDVNHQPAPTAMMTGLQEQLDPSGSAGQGRGLAAPGATIVVSTPGVTTVAVAATIVPEAGYSVNGAGGTISLAADITAAVAKYFLTLGVGDTVIHNQVLGSIVKVNGVQNVSALTLNTVSGDLTITSTNVAELTLPVTLT